MPRPPEDLDSEALLEWYRICDDLQRLGKIDKSDRAIITVYCRCWATHQVLAKRVGIEGPIRLLDNGYQVATPFHKELIKVTNQLSRLLDQLGLTPSSRKSVVPERKKLEY